MNVFERWQATQKLVAKALVPTWAEFRDATNILLASYNAIEPGMQYPAEITEQDGSTIVIAGGRQQKTAIRISADLRPNDSSIGCLIEEWEMIQGRPAKGKPESAGTFVFFIRADPAQPDTWLSLSSQPDKHFTAFEAAEYLLSTALLPR